MSQSAPQTYRNDTAENLNTASSSSAKRTYFFSPEQSFFQSQNFGVQPKLTVNAPDDKYEREADRVADAVMRIPDPQIQCQSVEEEEEMFQMKEYAPAVQRKCTACEAEESLQRHPMENEKMMLKPIIPAVQRKCTECEAEAEEKLQRKPLAGSITPFFQRKEADGAEVNPQTAASLQSTKGGGQCLPDTTRSWMESRFGTDFSQVKIHTDTSAVKLSRDLNATAFTHGSHIYFNQGKFLPATNDGKRLLAHELTHVVQQRSNRRIVQRQSARRINPNLAEVQHNNERYRVTRRVSVGRRRGTTTGSVEGDIDQTNVTITIKVCRNRSRGQVQLGANVPERAREIAQEIVNSALQGSGSGIEESLRGADITPFVEILFARSGQFSLTARGEVTVGLEGVTAGGGSLNIQSGEFEGSIRGRGGDEGWSVGVDVTVTPGREDETFECTRVPITVTFECQKWHDPSRQQVPIQVPFRNRQTRFIYFNFAESTIDREASEAMLDDITDLLQQGYRVIEITGHTSPEGPQQRSRRFIGNERLGQERADAALAEIQRICEARRLLAMRSSGRCASAATLNVEPIGEGELHTLTDEQGREVEGTELAQHAIEEFRGAESESLHRDEELMERMRDMSLDEQQDIVYPLLRRAEITLEKSGMREVQHTINTPGGFRTVGCPPEVERAARLIFGL